MRNAHADIIVRVDSPEDAYTILENRIQNMRRRYYTKRLTNSQSWHSSTTRMLRSDTRRRVCDADDDDEMYELQEF